MAVKKLYVKAAKGAVKLDKMLGIITFNMRINFSSVVCTCISCDLTFTLFQPMVDADLMIPDFFHHLISVDFKKYKVYTYIHVCVCL